MMRYAGSFILGMGWMVTVFMIAGQVEVYLDADRYQKYTIFVATILAAYALIGVLAGVVGTLRNIAQIRPYALALALPMCLFMLVNFGDVGPEEYLPRIVVALFPLSAIVGAVSTEALLRRFRKSSIPTKPL